METYTIKLGRKKHHVKLEKTTYAANRHLAVRLVEVPGDEYFATITVNIDFALSGDKSTHAFIDTNNYGIIDIEKFLNDNKIATPTGRTGQSGYCTYPEYRFDLSKF